MSQGYTGEGIVATITSGGGTFEQRVRSTLTAVSTYSSSVTIPVDNTIPQNTEGSEIMTVTITPTNASSVLRVKAHVNVANLSATGTVVLALFRDSTANAVCTAWQNFMTTFTVMQVNLDHAESAGSTSSTTFKLRIGHNTGQTLTVNGYGGNNYFNGTLISSLEVEEILP